MAEEARRGVMDASYSKGRLSKPHLRFRYRVRGQVAVDGFRRIHPDASFVRVLEMGAADGLTLLHIRELLGAGEFLGVEYAQELLDTAPGMPDDLRLIQGDVTNLPGEVPENHYDLVSCLAVLEHLEDPQRAVGEAFRVLKLGGVLVATCPNPFWDKVAGKFGLVQDEFHAVEITGDVLLTLSEKAGFRYTSYEPFMWVVTGVLSYTGLNLNPKLSLKIDGYVRRLGVLDFSFVNQAVVAVK